MNDAQKLWWRQARSDYDLFIKLRSDGSVHESHLLHYLQMSTEKLSKAYLWRSGEAPAKSHTGFVRFLKALVSRPGTQSTLVAKSLGFRRPEDLKKWVASVQWLAYQVQNLAPAEALNGPNPEYPWPHDRPSYCPAEYAFPLWVQLSKSGQGRRLLDVIERAIDQFAAIA